MVSRELGLALEDGGPSLAALPVAETLCERFRVALRILFPEGAAIPPALSETLQRLPPALGSRLVTLSPEAMRQKLLACAGSDPAPGLMLSTAATGTPPLTPLARDVLAEASGPVLIVPAARGLVPWSPRSVLLPHDGSPTFRSPARAAARVAHTFGAELILLAIEPRPGQALEPGRHSIPRYLDNPAYEWDAWGREWNARLAALGEPGRGVRLRPLVGIGTSGEAVARAFGREQPDLLVLGWEGQFEAGQGLILTEQLERGQVPILVVPLIGGQVDPRRFAAILFDMDGVITKTADAHAAAWKRLFDEYLARRGAQEGHEFAPFDLDQDYRTYVDGKPRYDGVQSFLVSRGVTLPRGTPRDDPDTETICGLGNRKNQYFQEHIRLHGVSVFDTSVAFVRHAKAHGLRTALVTASQNAGALLARAGIADLFDAQVDGRDSMRLGLAGKPAPDTYLEAARRLAYTPDQAVVVEDAEAGVEAGRAGRFGLVIGIDRGGHGERLLQHGADVVVADLHQLAIATPAAASRAA